MNSGIILPDESHDAFLFPYAQMMIASQVPCLRCGAAYLKVFEKRKELSGIYTNIILTSCPDTKSSQEHWRPGTLNRSQLSYVILGFRFDTDKVESFYSQGTKQIIERFKRNKQRYNQSRRR